MFDKMKRFLFISVLSSVIFLGNCMAQNPFGKTYKMPCRMKNDANYFGATGTAYGERECLDQLLLDAHENATQQIYRRMQHVVEGKIKTFNETIGSNSNRVRNMNNLSAIERTIMDMLNAVENSCEEISEIDEKGNVSVYVGFQIPKKQLVETFTKELGKGQSAAIQRRAKEVGEQFAREIKEIKDKHNDSKPEEEAAEEEAVEK